MNGIDQSFYRNLEFPDLSLEGTRSLIRLVGKNLVCTALKGSEDGTKTILRFFNVGPEETRAYVECLQSLETVEIVDLEEKFLRALEIKANRTQDFSVRAGQIVTLAFR